MKTLSEMSPAEVRHTLDLFAVDAAVASYRRRFPKATEDEAWQWAVVHKGQFRTRAVNMLAAVLLCEEEKSGQGQSVAPDRSATR